jgi:hypothetical protein
LDVFGEPPSSTAYTVCVYYDDALQATLAVPAGTAWRAVPAGRGYTFSDPAAGAGTRKLRLRAGRAGAPELATLLLRGRGDALPDPALPIPANVGTVTVQVLNSANATCWGDAYTRPFAIDRAGSRPAFKGRR